MLIILFKSTAALFKLILDIVFRFFKLSGKKKCVISFYSGLSYSHLQHVYVCSIRIQIISVIIQHNSLGLSQLNDNVSFTLKDFRFFT